MSEDDGWECGCQDLATERASALCELALNIGAVREPKAKKAMLRAMEALTDGIESAVRPGGKRANVSLIRQVPPDAS